MGGQSEWLNRAVAGFLGSVTRREGRKFLQLSEQLDEESVRLGWERSAEISMYIHIPFCRTLCPFCCFNRYLFNEARARRYFINLKKEVELYINKGFKLSNFYLGGGTPTVLMDELLDFIDFLKKKFAVKEISLETTPRELDPERIRWLKSAGVKRLSIGVQSFDNDLLKAMGRTNTSGEEAREKLRLAQGNFDTVNIDLIFNFPGQSLEKFAADVASFKSMGIDQATFYPLMPSPHKMTALERKFNRLDTSREKDFYNIIMRELCIPEYKASTVWCFSRGDRMIDEYIVDYDDYIGVGAGSVSFLRGNFYVNTFSLERYDELTTQGKLPVVRWRRLAEREALRYYMLTRLFGMTMDPEKFRRRFGDDGYNKLRLELAFLRLFGLIQKAEKITVTRRGMYSVSCMMKEFFAALNGLREYCIENRI